MHDAAVRGRLLVLPALLLFGLTSCASIGPSGLVSGEPKISLPFIEKKRVEEAHSVSIPPFYADDQGWEDKTQETFALSPRISIIPLGGGADATASKSGDLGALEPESRVVVLGRLGRLARSDAVLNGVVLTRGEKRELILQLVSSEDSRVLWLQAVEFTLKGDTVNSSDQRALLSGMLGPLIAVMGTKEKPPAPLSGQAGIEGEQPKNTTQPRLDTQPKSDSQLKTPAKAKPDKRPKKDKKQLPESDEISPM